MQVQTLFWQKKFSVNWIPTSHLRGKFPIIPWGVSSHLHLIGKVILVLWKLSLERLYRHLRQKYTAWGIFSSFWVGDTMTFLVNLIFNMGSCCNHLQWIISILNAPKLSEWWLTSTELLISLSWLNSFEQFLQSVSLSPHACIGPCFLIFIYFV